jgi:hypothetical protein
LTGRQAKDLTVALKSAFPSRDDFKNMLWFEVGQKLDDIVGDVGKDRVVPAVIERAEAFEWTKRLVVGATKANPTNSLLRTFYERVWLALDTPKRESLEDVIRVGNDFLDVEPWVDTLLRMGNRVCRVEVPTSTGKTIFGTGFLLGPAVVMTNYHVMEAPICRARGTRASNNLSANAADVRVRFDYRQLPDGSAAPGKTWSLNGSTLEDWLMDDSPFSRADLQAEPSALPNDDELDYALLRLSGRPGDDPVVQIGGAASTRGWIPTESAASTISAEQPLAILQHPQGDHLKLALESRAILGLNGNGTRVKYTTNTLGGSSGSPCFNQRWELIAIHHRGDPNFPTLPASSNQGVPFEAIMALLKTRGVHRQLGEGQADAPTEANDNRE